MPAPIRGPILAASTAWTRSASSDPAADSCANSEPGYNPFVSHAFFSAAEASGSATARTGWGPRHLLARLDGTIAGIVPCYLKSHSQGEYVFDRGWADAYERAGGRYYPKLQASVPFTPATGPRLLIRDGVDRNGIGAALARGLVALCDATDASSVHVTFAREAEQKFLAEHDFLERTDQQFHWHNQGYGSFDDFLATLNSRHRKAIKRERREALAAGITIHALTGSDITEDAWDAFFAFYMETGSRKWGRPYLNRKFFSLIGETMSKDVLLVMAKRNGRWIAGAINFIGSDTLFGRNWGAVEHHPFLHFEVCYYQAIDFAIKRGLKRSRPARKASTRSRAAICRRRPIPRITSPTPVCAGRSRTTSSASAPMSRKPGAASCSFRTAAPAATHAAGDEVVGLPRRPIAVPGRAASASTGGFRHRISGVGTGTMAIASTSRSMRV